MTQHVRPGRFEGTQLVVISNTLWVGEQVPCLTYGMRGMISLSIEVRPVLTASKSTACFTHAALSFSRQLQACTQHCGHKLSLGYWSGSSCLHAEHTMLRGMQVRGPARDLHSGNDGGVFNEPLADLTKVCHRLTCQWQARYVSLALTDANGQESPVSPRCRPALQLVMPSPETCRNYAQIQSAFLRTQGIAWAATTHSSEERGWISGSIFGILRRVTEVPL